MKNLLKDLGIENEIANKIFVFYKEEMEKEKTEYQEDFKNTKAQLKLKEKELNTLTKQLDNLKEVDIDKLKSELEKVQQDQKIMIENHIKEMEKVKIDSKVDLALLESGAKNLKATKALIDMGLLKLEKDNIIGLKEQIKTLTDGEDTKFLFNPQSNETQDVKVQGLKPVESGDTPATADTSKMSYAQLCNYYGNENN